MTVRWGTVELVTALIICEPFLIMPACSKSLPTMKPVRFCRKSVEKVVENLGLDTVDGIIVGGTQQDGLAAQATNADVAERSMVVVGAMAIQGGPKVMHGRVACPRRPPVGGGLGMASPMPGGCDGRTR